MILLHIMEESEAPICSQWVSMFQWKFLYLNANEVSNYL